MSHEAAARALVEVCRALHSRGWVANHDGNVSARLDEGHILCSPTAVSKGAVSPEMLVVVDAEGKVIEGRRRVFSEISLHLAAYRARPDVAWVVHAHPPYATAWAVSGASFFDPPFLREPVVSLGERVPLVSERELGALTEVDAVLLRSHGALTLGPDAETALLRMELVEHLARIAALARPLGGPVPLDRGEVEAALAARAKAGLGASRGVPSGGAVAPVGEARPDLAELVRSAMSRVR